MRMLRLLQCCWQAQTLPVLLLLLQCMHCLLPGRRATTPNGTVPHQPQGTNIHTSTAPPFPPLVRKVGSTRHRLPVCVHVAVPCCWSMGTCCSKRHRHLQLWRAFSQHHPSSTGSTQLSTTVSQPHVSCCCMPAFSLPLRKAPPCCSRHLLPAAWQFATHPPPNPGRPPHQVLVAPWKKRPPAGNPPHATVHAG